MAIMAFFVAFFATLGVVVAAVKRWRLPSRGSWITLGVLYLLYFVVAGMTARTENSEHDALRAELRPLINQAAQAAEAWQSAANDARQTSRLLSFGEGYTRSSPDDPPFTERERLLMEHMYSAHRSELDTLIAANTAVVRLRQHTLRDRLSDFMTKEENAAFEAVTSARFDLRAATARESRSTRSPAGPRAGNWWVDGMQERYERDLNRGGSGPWYGSAERRLSRWALTCESLVGESLPAAALAGELDPTEVLE